MSMDDEPLFPDLDEARRELLELYPTVEALCAHLRELERELATFKGETGRTDFAAWYTSRYGGAVQPDGETAGAPVQDAA